MKLRTARSIVQISTLGLLFLIPTLNRNGITFITGSLYSLAIGPVWITDPLSGLQATLISLRPDGVLLLSIAVPIAISLLFGRVFCGWVCPQNTLSEIYDYIARRIKIKRPVVQPPSSAPRYVALSISLTAAVILGYPIANLISAPGLISVQIAKFMYEGMFDTELLIISMILVLELFVVRRLWCNYICPVGGLLGLLRTARTMRIVMRLDPNNPCLECRACSDTCGLGLDPTAVDISSLCHNCGDCISACADSKGRKGILSFGFKKTGHFHSGDDASKK